MALGSALQKDDQPPAPEEIDRLVANLGEAPPENVRRLFPLIEALRAAMQDSAAPAETPGADGGQDPVPVPDQSAVGSALTTLQRALDEVAVEYLAALELAMKESDSARSRKNMAANMAPTNQKHELLMQKMEDASLRQLWRVTRMFLMVKRVGGERELEEPDPPRKRPSRR